MVQWYILASAGQLGVFSRYPEDLTVVSRGGVQHVRPASRDGGILFCSDKEAVEGVIYHNPNLQAFCCESDNITEQPLLAHTVDRICPHHRYVGPRNEMECTAFEELLNAIPLVPFRLSANGSVDDPNMEDDGPDPYRERHSKVPLLFSRAWMDAIRHSDRPYACLSLWYHSHQTLRSYDHLFVILADADMRLRDVLSNSFYSYADGIVGDKPMNALLLLDFGGGWWHTASSRDFMIIPSCLKAHRHAPEKSSTRRTSSASLNVGVFLTTTASAYMLI